MKYFFKCKVCMLLFQALLIHSKWFIFLFLILLYRYEELLAVKVERLEGMIRQVIVDTPECHVDYLDDQDEPQSIETLNFLPPTEVFESPKEGFRMRANFKVWRTGDAETVSFKK